MPYIKKEKRESFSEEVERLAEKLRRDPENVEGNLNYVFTKLILSINPKNYKEWNGVIGALECCRSFTGAR